MTQKRAKQGAKAGFAQRGASTQSRPVGSGSERWPSELRLGVDIGRVLISAGDTRGDTSFIQGSDEQALLTPPMPGAFEVIEELVPLFGGRVWLVSKCGPKIQQRSLRWLKRWDFYAVTGVRPDRVLFCKERRQKADHCARHRITHFVDDRADVLQHLNGLVPWLYLYGPQRHAPPVWCEHVENWRQVRARIRQSLASETLAVPAL
ncbi:MAG: hypothetical protein AB7K71_27395 [Polyangiaceae bacterium]